MKKIPFCITLLISASLSLVTATNSYAQKNAQEEEVHASLIQGKKKSLIAFAGKEHSFSMEVAAKSAKLSDVPGFITIDKQIVQATLVPASLKSTQTTAQTSGQASPTTSQEKDILTRYMNYELAYYRKKLKQNYTNLQTEWITILDRLFLVWYFDMPKDYKLVSRQIYYSTLFYDQIIDLNAPLFKMDNFSKARGILLKLANSLKTYDKQLDLAKLAKQLNK
ncbi:hypothetical protein ACX0G9_01200 [Flavitalea flava]